MLAALGLSAFSRAALAGPVRLPSRIVFFVQPHGQVPKGWNLPMPGVPYTQDASAALTPLTADAFPEVLRPLHPFRRKLLVTEGLAHTSMLWDIAEVQRTQGDLNNHQVAVADLLTGARAAQIPGARCTGGARSLDQVLADRTAGPGRFGSRVYGADYVPNQTVSPFSFLGPKQASPVVYDPGTAFSDLVGITSVAPPNGTVEQKLKALSPSVLDAVSSEYTQVAQSLGGEGRARLEQHRALVRDLEVSVATQPAQCELHFDASSDDRVTQFMRLITLALSCDLTRVVTYVAPVPRCPEFGYPANADVHASYAHASIEGATSCGALFSKAAERAMVDLGSWYARHFAALLSQLDAVPEGDGTLLDHTTVVWMTELGTPTHEHHDTFNVIAGGGNGFWQTGRYVRFGRTLPSPLAMPQRLGPAHNRLMVSLLQSMGQPDTSFGLEKVRADDGTELSLAGPLPRLHRSRP
ncbi:MAG: DUF1552 domain-containing protein [Archangiaceae bacterium]|nr:DUF1552 domain-containing protein [Archangiaceae bacterium]